MPDNFSRILVEYIRLYYFRTYYWFALNLSPLLVSPLLWLRHYYFDFIIFALMACFSRQKQNILTDSGNLPYRFEYFTGFRLRTIITFDLYEIQFEMTKVDTSVWYILICIFCHGCFQCISSRISQLNVYSEKYILPWGMFIRFFLSTFFSLIVYRIARKHSKCQINSCDKMLVRLRPEEQKWNRKVVFLMESRKMCQY